MKPDGMKDDSEKIGDAASNVVDKYIASPTSSSFHHDLPIEDKSPSSLPVSSLNAEG